MINVGEDFVEGDARNMLIMANHVKVKDLLFIMLRKIL